MSYFGWEGKEVRHVDGRTGVIVQEIGREYCDLVIHCEDGTTDCVTLNCHAADYGSPGWQWWCPEFCHGPAWLPLGDGGGRLEYDPPKVSDNS